MTPFRRVLIANRGEIAIRIAQTAADLGIASVAVHPADDAMSLHVRRADQAVQIPGVGAAAYLDIAGLIDAARRTGCDAVHPGYGFLSETAAFARACFAAGLAFVGPAPETLDVFGDKGAARRLAVASGIPVARGTDRPTSLAEMRACLEAWGGTAVIKAVGGGGGRGMRLVASEAGLEDAFTRAAAEAKSAFGSDALYIEELIAPARHMEVQVLGDREGAVVHIHDRECSLQRRYQKLVEIAPCPGLDSRLRRAVTEAALTLARAARVSTLCTFEFLLGEDGRFVFMEANPRLQVEHTVTEEVTGIDLVWAQFETAAGRSLASLGMTQGDIPAPAGMAIELRINLERVGPDGTAMPTQGTMTAFEMPTGRGIRVETAGYAGYATSSRYDALLAKLIVHSAASDFAQLCDRACRALGDVRIEGVETNIGFLQSLLRHEAVRAGRFDTRFIEQHAMVLTPIPAQPRHFPSATALADEAGLALLAGPAGTVAIRASLTGRLAGFEVTVGQPVRPGQVVAIIEAMKMEVEVTASVAGTVHSLAAEMGAILQAGAPVLFLDQQDAIADVSATPAEGGDAALRSDLLHVQALHDALSDAARPDAVATRRRSGQRTARENIDDLCDAGSFHEYGALAVAAQRRRRSVEALRTLSPADGLVAGIGTVNVGVFGEEAGRCMAMAYDYTVFAGTQGFMNHKKMDRLFRLAGDTTIPLVVFAEGGGGRPGETDYMGVAGLDLHTFQLLSRLSARAPSVAVVSGRCFAGNAAIAGCCDLLVATRNATLGMGGPAMIEGGGLGRHRPEAVGPVSVQTANGVIDVLVEDEAEAVRVTKRYLAFFQGRLPDWHAADQQGLRGVVPENRVRAYDVRRVIALLADTGSALELRLGYGPGMVTTLARIEGRTVGLIANNPRHLGGAIDSDAAEKAARFIELCDTYAIPIVSLCDTPGFMVGPDAEKTGLVRRAARLFLTAANIAVPLFTIVLRKGYGLGAMSMAGGSTAAPGFVVSWPTGEFGGMGLEGAVTLGYRSELAAIADPAARQARFDELLAGLYENGKATNMAAFLEIDAVIDPAETRRWLVRGLASFSQGGPKGRRFLSPY